ncbi:MAG: hypothetical protein IIA50_05235 [Bacteroidetes bacterium]|nr:hypothetical protein [Bacteroidota bacterium]
MKRPTWLLAVVAALIVAPLGFVLQSCTDLDEDTFGIVTPEEFYQTDAEILAGLAALALLSIIPVAYKRLRKRAA